MRKHQSRIFNIYVRTYDKVNVNIRNTETNDGQTGWL